MHLSSAQKLKEKNILKMFNTFCINSYIIFNISFNFYVDISGHTHHIETSFPCGYIGTLNEKNFLVHCIFVTILMCCFMLCLSWVTIHCTLQISLNY